jgi:hypothetical protein
MLNTKLMTYEKYTKIKHKIPYFYKIKFGSQLLYYFGESHSFDPKRKQWKQVKKFWNEFLEDTKGKKRIVFLEGGNPPADTTERKSIVKYGGGGLVAYLAKKAGIKTVSAEPNEKYERSQLEKVFPREVIQYYYFARVVHQWGRYQDNRPDFEKYITRYLSGDKRESGWRGFDFSLPAMKKIHKDLFKTEFDENDFGFFGDVSNPISQKTKVNKVSRTSGDIRDMHIIDIIKKYLKDGFNIFSIYGYTHVVMQEPVLKIFSQRVKTIQK